MLLPLLMTLAARSVDFYIGTYTAKDASKGIYRASLDEATGAISKPVLVAEAENPSFLALRGGRLYAVRETAAGEASAYAILPDGGLRELSTVSGLGAAPCHLSVGAKGKNLLVANYGPGTLSVLPILEDGSLSGPSQTFRHAGSGPNEGRQEGPHAHFVQTDARARFAYACDLGTDEILVYPYDPKRGDLGEATAVKTAPGAGPRHLAFGKGFVYANNELDNTVVVYRVDGKTGGLTPMQSLSTLPSDFKGHSSTAEIALHPNGRFLYVSNRGDDSVAVFSVGRDGGLALVEIRPLGLKEPRGFAFEPSGRWLVAGGQNSDELVAFPVDPRTGRLGAATGRAAVGKPVCVVFRG